jgi:amino acid transporter
MEDNQPSVFFRLRRALLGAPIASSKAYEERLGPFLGLTIFSCDALSSVAYATEAILLILIYLSTQALQDQIWISLAIVGLILIITTSYAQTIHAYSSGGGSYIVASDNLGKGPGLVAAAALLIDYILTVTVSTAAGVAAVISAVPEIRHFVPDAQVTLSLFAIALVAFANLRGLRESGSLFALPTYGFILTMTALIGFGLYTVAHTPATPLPHVESNLIGGEAGHPYWFMILRAFAAGCTALTGIEAVSNGVQVFRSPESKNATKTLVMMSALLTFLFLGLGWLALKMPYHYPRFSIYESNSPHYITLTAQVAAFVFGAKSIPFFAIQFFVAAILILAANTAFAGFPRLASMISTDGYLPRYLSRLGDKLVFHNGIVLLAICAGALVCIFHGQLDALLPLYAIGVFTAFTLSQIGMVVHWWRLRGKGWQVRLGINGVGAVLCAVVLVIIAATKFREGAWLVLVLIPLICFMFWMVQLRYRSISKQLEIDRTAPSDEPTGHIALVLVPRIHRGVVGAVRYAKQFQGEVQAVHITLNEKGLPELQRKWQEFGHDIPLVILPSPYRSLIQPVLDYVDRLREANPGVIITVIVAEAVSTRWYQKLLTENVAQQLKIALASRRRVVVANTRYFLD